MTDRFNKQAPERLEVHGLIGNADLLASNISLREKVAIGLLVLFAGAVISTYVLIFFWGFKLISLPNGFAHWLGAATVGQTASLLFIIVRDLFPSQNRKSRSKKANAST